MCFLRATHAASTMPLVQRALRGSGPYRFTGSSQHGKPKGPTKSATDDHGALHHNARTTDDDHPVVILIIVVGTALIDISPASVLLGLAWWHSTVAPTCLLALIPSRGTLIRISIRAVLVSVALLPSLIGVLIAFCGVRVS